MTAITFFSRIPAARRWVVGVLGLLFVLNLCGSRIFADDDHLVAAANWSSSASAQCGSDRETWWDSVCNGFRTWRRHLRRSHQEANRCLYHPKYEPHFSATYGYHETQWGAFPCDYGYASTGAIVVQPSAVRSMPAIESPPPRSLPHQSIPMVPGAEEPADSYFPPDDRPSVPQQREAPPKPLEGEASALFNLRPVDDNSDVEELFSAPEAAELPRIRPNPRPRETDETIGQAWRPSTNRREIPLPPQVVLEEPEPAAIRILLQ